MKSAFKTLVFIVPLMFMLCVDVADRPAPTVTLIRDAEAIIGLPFTPLSFAGVARRTTRRAVWAGAAATAVVTTPAAAPTSVVVVNNPPPPAAHSSSAVPIGTVVQALPEGCRSVVVSDVSYSDCGGAFYKAAFQGNNLVYIVVENPLK